MMRRICIEIVRYHFHLPGSCCNVNVKVESLRIFARGGMLGASIIVAQLLLVESSTKTCRVRVTLLHHYTLKTSKVCSGVNTAQIVQCE